MNALLQPYYVHRIFNPTYHILLRILHALYVTYPSLSGSLAVTDRVVSHHAFGKVLVDMAQDCQSPGMVAFMYKVAMVPGMTATIV